MTEAFLGLLVFILFMVGTPGPANMLVMLGGVRFGVRGCTGFILGLVVGKLGLNVLFGIGLGYGLAEQETFLLMLKFAGGGYMAWLSLRSWTPAPDSGVQTVYGFRNGVLVHPLNPKAWVMVLLAWTQFAPAFGGLWKQMLVVTLTFSACQIVAHTLWCGAGQVLGRSLPNSLLLTRVLILITLGVVVWALLQ